MDVKTVPIAERRSIRQALARWWPWLQKGGFAVADRGLFAATNFLANVVLARWMPPEEYGAFATAYSLFLLLNTFHSAMLAEPMMVFGSGKYASHFRRYLAFGYTSHAVISLAASAILLLGGALVLRFGSGALGLALLGLALAAPFIMLLWLLRQVFYIVARPQWAAAGGAIYLAVMLVGLAGVNQLGALSSLAAFVVMGAAALLTCALYTTILRPQWGGVAWREMLRDHWTYGRWSTATAGLMWLPGNINYILVPAWIGFQGSAALKAMQNFIMPVLLTISAVTLVLVPEYVRILRTHGKSKLDNVVLKSVSLLFSLALVYGLLLAVVHTELLHWLYKGRYDAYADLLVVVGFIPLASSAYVIMGGALRALERPDLIFRSYLVSSLFSLTIGVALIVLIGLLGAILSQTLTAIITGLTMIIFYIDRPKYKSDVA